MLSASLLSLQAFTQPREGLNVTSRRGSKHRHASKRMLQSVCFSRDRIDQEPGAPKASRIPDFDEDREVMHSAFMHAFQEAQPERVRLPGMQEFAAGILSRTRIPSQQYVDPLSHVFQEFDKDNDGYLTAPELAAALRSRNVTITDEQAQMFIDVVDVTATHSVNQAAFRELVLHMAAADLHSRKQQHNPDDGEWVTCTLEDDEEIQVKLSSWLEKIMTIEKK